MQEHRERAGIHRERAKPQQMRRHSRQFAADRADILATLGNFFFYTEQFLDRQHVVHVVGQRREVIQSIRVRDELVVGHALGDLFIAAMQIAHVRFGLGDDFPVHLQP